MLTDSGPLIALIDADEPDHEVCRLVLGRVPLPLVTTWPAFTEAMYILTRVGGITGQDALWRLVLSGRLEIAELPPTALERSAALMAKYADPPMDLADATLIALAEHWEDRRIFTLDADFQEYRLFGRQRFEIVPR